MTELLVIPSGEVGRCVDLIGGDAVEIVGRVYRDHANGLVYEAPHSFLRLPDGFGAERGIALPAAIADGAYFGVKWICSSPQNLEFGLPRASGVLVLCDRETGRPSAILPAGRISTIRTAASAVLAVEAACLSGLSVCGVIGAGRVAAAVLQLLFARGALTRTATVLVRDTRPEQEKALIAFAASLGLFARSATEVADVFASDIVVIATASTSPYLDLRAEDVRSKMILHLSLRDIGPASMAQFGHWVDDFDLAVSNGTSLGDAVASGLVDRSCIAELGGILGGARVDQIAGFRPICFSPFGMGALDLAVGLEVCRLAARESSWVLSGFETEGSRGDF